MNSHLVTIEVGVVSRTYERMKLNCSALNKYRLECLNTESVQCRGTVEKNRVILDYLSQHIPYRRIGSFYHTLCALYVERNAAVNKSSEYERLEQFKRHFLRQTALIHIQLRSYDYNGTSRIVYTLTEKVLTETSLLTLEHFAEGFKRTVSCARYHSASATVIYECINCFLKHTLFVADYDFRSVHFNESLETVVSVYNTSVKIVKVRRCESAAVYLNHRTYIRRNYGQCRHYHPFRLISGINERFNNLKTLYYTCLLLT